MRPWCAAATLLSRHRRCRSCLRRSCCRPTLRTGCWTRRGRAAWRRPRRAGTGAVEQRGLGGRHEAELARVSAAAPSPRRRRPPASPAASGVAACSAARRGVRRSSRVRQRSSNADFSAAARCRAAARASGRLNVKSIAAQYSGAPCCAPVPVPSESSFADHALVRDENVVDHDRLAAGALAGRPCASRRRSRSRSAGSGTSGGRPAGSFRLEVDGAVSQLQWSTPLEKKPRPVQR